MRCIPVVVVAAATGGRRALNGSRPLTSAMSTTTATPTTTGPRTAGFTRPCDSNTAERLGQTE